MLDLKLLQKVSQTVEVTGIANCSEQKNRWRKSRGCFNASEHFTEELAGSLACPQTDDGSCTGRSTSHIRDDSMTDLSAQYIFTDWDFSPMASCRRPEHLGVNGLNPSSKDGLAEHCTPHVLVPHPIPPDLTLFSLLTSYVKVEMKPREEVSTTTSSLVLHHCHERPWTEEYGLKSHIGDTRGQRPPPQCNLSSCTWSCRPSLQLC